MASAWLPKGSVPESTKIRQGLSRRGVERDLHLDAPCGAEDLNALVRHKLRAATKYGWAFREIEDGRGYDISSHFRVLNNHSKSADRFLCKNQSGDVNQVTPYIHQRAASEFRNIAYILRIAIVVAEATRNGSDCPDAPLFDALKNANPLRMRP